MVKHIKPPLYTDGKETKAVAINPKQTRADPITWASKQTSNRLGQTELVTCPMMADFADLVHRADTQTDKDGTH